MPIEVFDAAAPEAVYDFLGERIGARGRAHWDWKYRVGRGGAPNAFYWRGDDGAVLGFIGMMRTLLHGPGGPWPAAWFVDWQVVPGERGVGVGVGLLRKAEAAAGILLTLQGSADTRRVLPLLGWKESPRAATWLRPLSGRFVAGWARKRLPGWLGAPVGVAAGAALALLAGRQSGHGAVARDVERLPPEHDEMWQRRCGELAPLMTRDRAYVDWFCSDYPGGGYRIALLDSGGVAAGHLITRTDRDSAGLLRGRIVDLVWPRAHEQWLADAVGLACRRLKAEGADYVQCLSSRPELDAALERQRFRRRAPVPVWYHRLPAEAPRPDAWLISLLDCDRAYR